jgi:hypothetical protein
MKVIILDNVSWELKRVYLTKIFTYNDYEKLKEADFGRSKKIGSLIYNLKSREGIFGVFLSYVQSFLKERQSKLGCYWTKCYWI